MTAEFLGECLCGKLNLTAQNSIQFQIQIIISPADSSLFTHAQLDQLIQVLPFGVFRIALFDHQVPYFGERLGENRLQK